MSRFKGQMVGRTTLLVAVLVLAVLGKLVANGSVFGFDYGLYQPDGAHYTFRTLVFLGHDQIEAAREVVRWYKIHSVDTKNLNLEQLLPQSNPLWGLSIPRIVYPVFSMIPVYFFGIPGMLFVPIISLIILVFVINRLATKHGKPNLGLIIIILMLASPTLLRWMLSNCTDSLLVALIATHLFLTTSSIGRNWKTFLEIILITLASFTRFCLPIWIAIYFVEYLYKRGNLKPIFLMTLSAILSLPAILLQPGGTGALLPEQGSRNFFQKIVYLPYSYLKIGFVELAELAVLDRILLFFVVLGILVASLNKIGKESLLFFLVFFAVWTIGALNGVVGVNFRYQLPLIPYLAFIIIIYIPEISFKERSKDE